MNKSRLFHRSSRAKIKLSHEKLANVLLQLERLEPPKTQVANRLDLGSENRSRHNNSVHQPHNRIENLKFSNSERSSQACYDLAAKYFKSGNMAGCYAMLEAQFRVSGAYERGVKLARYCVNRGDIAAGLLIYDQLIGISSDPDLLLKKANLQITSKDLVGAKKTIDTAVQSFPAQEEVQLAKYTFYKDILKDDEGALAAVKSVINLKPQIPEYQLMAYHLELKLGRLDEARARLQTIGFPASDIGGLEEPSLARRFANFIVGVFGKFRSRERSE